ncbi:MAG: hypothetical protein AAE983_05930 [Thermoplasmataceae archaeon]|jgi:hypothetical protein
MFRKLMEPGGLPFYDMAPIISYSKNLIPAEKGYTPDHEYKNQVTVILAFCVTYPVVLAIFIC